MKTPFLYLFLFLLSTITCSARQLAEKGVPYLQNFTPAQYNNPGKIWGIDSAPNGIVYMAAERGLVEYDGKNWKSYKGSIGFTRSILAMNDSLIYTGSDLDFGVWKKNQFQDFEYTSLYPFREDLAELSEEFWEIHRVGDNILFVSDFNIYVYRNDNLTKISAPDRFIGSYSLNSTIYFADKSNGLFQLSELSLTPVIEFPEDSDFEITGIYDHDEGLVLVTYNSGLYLYSSGTLRFLDNPLSRDLQSANVFSFERIGEHYFAFGTVQKGLFISDDDGNVIHYINRNKGLPNNTILSLHYSHLGRLWLGLDYGISSLDLKSNLTYFYDYRGDFGTGYTALLQDGLFYLGTNKGLYQSGWEGLNDSSEFFSFNPIPDSEGQVWTLKNIDDELFVGHDRGLFTVNQSGLNRLSDEQGFWTILPYEDYLLGGTYNGIFIFEKDGDSWSFLKQMELILGSTNQLIIEKDNIFWINIPNYGIIRTVLTEDLYPEDRRIFFSESFEGNNPHLVKSERGMHVQTDQYEYIYSESDSSFTEKRMIGYPSGPEDMLPDMFLPVSLNAEYEFIPLYNGFALKNLSGNDENGDSLQNGVIFRKVEAFNNDSTESIYPGAEISYGFNNLKIEYLVPNQQDVEYQYRLGKNGTWSEWSPESEVEFLSLRNGEYQLLARARINGDISEAASFSFLIRTPWYLTWYAYFAYLLLIITVVYLIYLWQRISLKKQEEKLLLNKQKSLREQAENYRHQIMHLEQERLQADFDQLKGQLKSKTIELANKAKENDDKNRLLLDLKKKIEKLQQSPELSKSRWSEIHNLLDSYINQNDNTFEIQMDELHKEFYKRLMEEFPNLSGNDMRLCAYLKLGFNSKEIADFTNIQPSSVYINRSRLRKKLDLDADQDLHNFLNTY